MPSDVSINQIAETVSQKISASAQDAMGVVGGLTSTVTNGAASAFNALSSSVSKLGLSPQSLNAAVSQVTNALDATSLFSKGLPRSTLNVTEAKPEETRAAQKGDDVALKFPSDLGKHFIQLKFVSFSQNSPVASVAKVDPLLIQLPMSPNLQENYSIGYGTAKLGVLGSVTEKLIKNYFEDKDKGLIGGNDTFAQKASTILGGVVKVGMEEVPTALGALLAGAALATTGGVGKAIQNQVGASVNPNMAVLFDSVGFRKHQFSFKLYPTSAKESAQLRNIIKQIRDRIIPKQLNTQFLGFPDKVEIQIFPANPYVDKIRTCVIDNMSVNYAPNGVAFFKGGEGNPVAVELTLSFQETEIIFKDLRTETKKSVATPVATPYVPTAGE